MLRSKLREFMLKQMEDKKIATYAYGDDPGHLKGVIKYFTKDLSWKI